MLERVIFSGTGGQGLMFIGKLFAKMMLGHVEHLTFFPSYGSEVRGGTAHCQVVLSSSEIASPIVDEADKRVRRQLEPANPFPSCRPHGVGSRPSTTRAALGCGLVAGGIGLC